MGQKRGSTRAMIKFYKDHELALSSWRQRGYKSQIATMLSLKSRGEGPGLNGTQGEQSGITLVKG